jgi:ABC-type bacteriocin/lantibiotic exporter with double-glycine peptidase domain
MPSTFIAIVVAAQLAPLRGISTKDLDRVVDEVQRARHNCGPVALWYCLRCMGEEVRLEDVTSRAGLEKRGMRIDRLVALAGAYGHPATAMVGNPSELARLPIPSILIVADNHCIVYGGVDKSAQRLKIFDPVTCRVVEEPLDNLWPHWKGEAIVFWPPRSANAPLWSFLPLVFFIVVATERWRRRTRGEEQGGDHDDRDSMPCA